MRITSIALASLFIMLCACSPMESQNHKAMTFNIRYDNPDDGISWWENRRSEVANLINYYEPEVLGVQEALHRQLEYLDQHLPSYARIGVGRDDGKTKGEYTAIYYNSDILSVVDQSTFWLSETDDKVSVGWDASMERICTYGLFENKQTKQKIYAFNAHYDHRGELARTNSSSLIVKKIQEINTANHPVILMGDFNAEPNSKAISNITAYLKDGADESGNESGSNIYGPTGTFTGFEPNQIAERRIDYIFKKGVEVTKYRHIDDKMKNGNYVSDHLPVLIEFKY